MLDVLKARNPSLVEFVKEISKIDGINKVDAQLDEVDADTESIKLVIEGNGINYELLQESIKKLGAAVHSIDEVVMQRPSSLM